MAKYFNKGSSIAVVLRRGDSATLYGKSWTELAPEDEGSEDLIRAIKAGLILRSTVDDEVTSPVKEAKPDEKVETVAEKVEPAPVVTTQEEETTSTIDLSYKSEPKDQTVGDKASEPRRKRG